MKHLFFYRLHARLPSDSGITTALFVLQLGKRESKKGAPSPDQGAAPGLIE